MRESWAEHKQGVECSKKVNVTTNKKEAEIAGGVVIGFSFRGWLGLDAAAKKEESGIDRLVCSKQADWTAGR